MKINVKDILEKYEVFELEDKLRFANWFYKNYSLFEAQDIYSWLWIGEFGYHDYPLNDLNTLMDDIIQAQLKPSKIRKLWEPLGISRKFIKINIDIYFEAGYPLKRLLDLVERNKSFINIDKLTFKNSWNLMKLELDFTQNVKLNDMNLFMEKIPFHMSPYYPFTENFSKEFGNFYRIVPMNDFFFYYPECANIYDELFIDAGISYMEVVKEET